MALVLKELYNNFVYYVNEARDTRLQRYLFMSPIEILTITSFYMFFVKKIGPKLMENRKPFELYYLMIVYNVAQVIANFVLCYKAITTMIEHQFNWRCHLSDYSHTERAIYEAQLTYCYYLLKISDLLDTIFFILRKKESQITFLHVYHHLGMVIGGYIFTNYMPGGHLASIGLINSFVHVVMYFYYLLTTLNSNLKKSIWWKKHLTQLQLIQFLILWLHFAYPLIFGDCKYPKGWLIVGFIQNIFLFALFGDFYVKAYIKKPKKRCTNKVNLE